MKLLNSLLVLFSLSGGIALATDPAPTLSSDPGVVAMISGVESDQHYETLPPIMVEFNGLEQDERIQPGVSSAQVVQSDSVTVFADLGDDEAKAVVVLDGCGLGNLEHHSRRPGQHGRLAQRQ